MARIVDPPALAACFRALARSGFVRYAPDRLDWPFSPSFHVWLRLHPRRFGDMLEIEAFIGIHAVEVERTWTALKTGPYRAIYRRHVPTFATPLAGLAGGDQLLLMPADDPSRPVMARLVALCHEVGLPHVLRLGALDALEPLLARRITALDGNPERYAACLLLQGRHAEATRFVESFAAGQPAYFAGFAGAFLRLKAQAVPDDG